MSRLAARVAGNPIDNGGAHVLPLDENGQHHYNADCPCKPIVENGVATHHGFVIRRRDWLLTTIYDRLQK